MAFCTPCWSEHGVDRHRIGNPKLCETCGITFYNKGAHRRHKRDPASGCLPIPAAEFRCCDCDLEFPTENRLGRHLRRVHSNTTAPPPPQVLSEHYCEECNKSFESADGLQSHKTESRVHNPLLVRKLKCLRGCNRKFNAPSGLIGHLESGACRSGITRKELDKVIIEYDKVGSITDPNAVLARQTGDLFGDLSSSDAADRAPQGSSDSGGRSAPLGGASNGAETLDGRRSTGASRGPFTGDNFSDGDGARISTPGGPSAGATAASGGAPAQTDGPFPTPPASPTDHRSTHEGVGSSSSSRPVADSATWEQLRAWLLPDGTFECPLCPDDSKRTFDRFMELQEHMGSPIEHPEKNKHCDTPTLEQLRAWLLPSGSFECPYCPDGSKRTFERFVELREHINSPTEHLEQGESCASSESGTSTPSIPPTDYRLPSGKYKCPLCPASSKRKFKSRVMLQNHMTSPTAHMPKLYHCADPALFGIVLPSGSGERKSKSFARLSALTQHVESGACQGGRAMFKGFLGLLNEVLSDAGLGAMIMVATE